MSNAAERSNRSIDEIDVIAQIPFVVSETRSVREKAKQLLKKYLVFHTRLQKDLGVEVADESSRKKLEYVKGRSGGMQVLPSLSPRHADLSRELSTPVPSGRWSSGFVLLVQGTKEGQMTSVKETLWGAACVSEEAYRTPSTRPCASTSRTPSTPSLPHWSHGTSSTRPIT